MLWRLRGWLYGAVSSDRGRLCCVARPDSGFAEKLNIGGVTSGGPADAGGVNATDVVLVAALDCAVDGDISTAERGVAGYAMEKERGVHRRCEDVLHASAVWSVSAVGFCFCPSSVHGRAPLSSIAVTGPVCIGLDCRIAFV